MQRRTISPTPNLTSSTGLLNGSARSVPNPSSKSYNPPVIPESCYGLKDSGFSAEFSVEEHDASGATETQFYLPNSFETQESAIEAAIKAGRQKIDVGFERGSVVVNG